MYIYIYICHKLGLYFWCENHGTRISTHDLMGTKRDHGP